MTHGVIDSFWSSAYAPHGYCLLWRPDLILTHLISDILIALAYFSIPFALVRFVRRRGDIQFGAIFWLFAVFIFACGMTHVLAAWNLWHGNYGLEGVVKAITAAASVPTAIILWRLLPRLLSLPSNQDLRLANDQLSAMVMERDEAVARLHEEAQERARAEQALVQLQKIEAIGQLTGGIAHDFNNLLQAISGNLELIEANPGKRETVVRWAGNARRAVERGARLTSQLLVFARARQMAMQPVHPQQVIEGMVDLLQRSIGPQVELVFDLEPGDPAVTTEATQLELAILNLAINARDAMPEGGTLTISSRLVDSKLPPELAPGTYLAIAVADTGQGMSPDVLGRALEPFFTTKDVGKGTGLGLSMAYGLARQSQGTLTVASEPGAGTSVTFFFPLAGEARPALEVAGPDSDDAPGPAAGLRLVLVDDDPDVRQLMVEKLKVAGFAVDCYGEPQAALDGADWAAADLLIVDYLMPGMNGAELLRAVRDQHPGLRAILISGYTDGDALDSLADPLTRVLRKPFSLDKLVEEAGRD